MFAIHNKPMQAIIIVALSLTLTACFESSPKIKRIEPDSITDLSGIWNDTDSRQVSEDMIDDALSRPWLTNYMRINKKLPVVIIGTVRNLSHEHINTATFIADIERALVNSGRVEFVASSEERKEIREERIDQDLNARADTRKSPSREIGADYMLKGAINTIIDPIDKRQIRYYQVDLALISLADNRKVWLGQKKIKKDIKGAKLRY